MIDYSRDFDQNEPTVALSVPLASQLPIANKGFRRKLSMTSGFRLPSKLSALRAVDIEAVLAKSHLPSFWTISEGRNRTWTAFKKINTHRTRILNYGDTCAWSWLSI